MKSRISYRKILVFTNNLGRRTVCICGPTNQEQDYLGSCFCRPGVQTFVQDISLHGQYKYISCFGSDIYINLFQYINYHCFIETTYITCAVCITDEKADLFIQIVWS